MLNIIAEMKHGKLASLQKIRLCLVSIAKIYEIFITLLQIKIDPLIILIDKCYNRANLAFATRILWDRRKE